MYAKEVRVFMLNDAVNNPPIHKYELREYTGNRGAKK